MQHNVLISILALVSIFTTMANSYPIAFRRIHLPSRQPQDVKFEVRDEAPTSTLVEPTDSIITIRLPQPNTASTSQSASTAQSTSTSESTSTTVTSTSSQQPSQTPATDGGRRKLVVAHHMVGNTFPYVKQDWLDDIVLAHDSGIDGFALNTGRDEWEPARIADA